MELQNIWILMWTVANVFSFTTLWFMIISILRSRRARGQLFNAYLIFSVFSDAAKNTIFFICNLINFFKFSPASCTTIGWGECFYMISNFWMGAVICNELKGMLVKIKQCERNPRDQHQAAQEENNNWRSMFVKSISVHIFALCMASIMLETTVDWIPDISIRTQCEALPATRKEMYYFWFFYIYFGMMIPTFYVIHVCYGVYRQGLLPLTGQTRALSFYFFRLLVMFFLLWIVFVSAVFLTGWFQAIAFVFINLAGFMSFCFAMTKPDVYEAVIDMAFCKEQRLTAEETLSNNRITRGITNVTTSRKRDSKTDMLNSIDCSMLEQGRKQEHAPPSLIETTDIKTEKN